jgi:hypothetical protein
MDFMAMKMLRVNNTAAWSGTSRFLFDTRKMVLHIVVPFRRTMSSSSGSAPNVLNVREF